MYQPKTGAKCGCRRGIERDNCPNCEGTGQVIDFGAIRARNDYKGNLENEYNEQRKLYMANKLSHQDFYCWLADRIGITIADLHITTDKILTSKDPHFNDIPLRQWDNHDSLIRNAAFVAGKRSWSLSDTVCVAKAIARRWLETRKQIDANAGGL